MIGATRENLNLSTSATFEDAEVFKAAWNGLVRQSAAGMYGIDVTSTFEWLRTGWITRDIEASLRIVIAESGTDVVAVVPSYLVRDRTLGLRRHRLFLAPSLYAGRCGFIVNPGNSATFATVMDFVLRGHERWDEFLFTVLDSSWSESLIKGYAAARGYLLTPIGKNASPFVELPVSGADVLGALGKKLRYNIRNSERKLKSLGDIEMRSYTEKSSVDEFIENVLAVERESWKHEAGTAITKHPRQEHFYRTLAPIAAQAGWLHSAVLLLENRPVAYVYGLLYEGVYYDLKESYVKRFAKIAPGHVLKKYLLTDLVERGVRLFDFMGRCEPYKMQWTDKVYAQTSYVMYNHTAIGNLLGLKKMMTRRFGKVPATDPTPFEH